MQLNELHPNVPELRQGWSDEEYAGRIEINLGRAGSIQLDADETGDAPDESALQQHLVEALVLAIEWANRRHWPLAQDFGLRLDWRTHGFFYLILRASEGISGAHWGALHNNPSRAMEQLNFAIGYLIDYCRWRDWPVEEAAYQAIISRGNN